METIRTVIGTPATIRVLTGRLSSLAAASTFITITGYIIQFVGLRALHWSATIIQLGVTLAMTCCRAWVRRGLASQPKCVPLEEGREAECLTLLFTGDEYNQRTQRKSSPSDHRPIRGWELQKLNSSLEWEPTSRPKIETGDYETEKTVRLYHKHCSLLKQPLGHCKWSSRLCVAVDNIMKYVTSTEDISIKADGAISQRDPLFWKVNTIHERPKAKPTGSKRFGHLKAGVKYKDACMAWMVDPNEIQSILDLWVFSLINRINVQNGSLVPTGIFYRRSEGDYEDLYSYFHILGSVNELNLLKFWFSGGFMSRLFHDSTELIRLSNGYPHLYPQKDLYKELQGLLITKREYPMRQICALELLSLFLSAIFSEISEINGDTRAVRPLYRAENTVVRSLSSCVVEAGLVKTASEANEYVIPMLSQHNLLPMKQSIATLFED